jgi:hypothetical protein
MQECYIFLTEIEIGKDSIYKVTQNKYKKQWLKWNTYFTSEAVAPSILIWQKKYFMKIGQNDLLVTPGWTESVCARACALGASFCVFNIFSITWSIFGFFQLFLSLRL